MHERYRSSCVSRAVAEEQGPFCATSQREPKLVVVVGVSVVEGRAGHLERTHLKSDQAEVP